MTRLVPQARLMELADMARDGEPEDAPFELPCREMLALLEHIDTLGVALDIEAGDYCRVCGCTQHTPCEPPCGWADEGLCTACRFGVEPCDGGEDGWVVFDRLTGKTLGDETGEVVYMDIGAARLAAVDGAVHMDPSDLEDGA